MEEAAGPAALFSKARPTLSSPVAFALREPGREEEIVMRAAPGATVGDLLAELSCSSALGAFIDGRPVAPDTPLARTGLRQGSTVELTAAAAAASAAADGQSRMPTAIDRPWGLRWVAGFDAGRIDRVTPGRWLVGAWARADLPLTDAGLGRGAVLCIDAQGHTKLVDLGSGAVARGDAEGRVRIGHATARLGPRHEERRAAGRTAPSSGWTDPWVRPHRFPSLPDRPLTPPAPPEEPPRPSGAALAPSAVALTGGLVLAVVLHQPLMALMGGLGALGAMTTWVLQHLRRRRGQRHARQRAARDAEAFETAVKVRASAEAERRRRRHPDLATVTERADLGLPELWGIRCGADPPEVAIGTGDDAWSVPVSGGEDRDADVRTFVDVPITAPLCPGRPLALVGACADVASVAAGCCCGWRPTTAQPTSASPS